MLKGKIVQVMGPVVDVVFEDGQLPNIKDALEVENNGPGTSHIHRIAALPDGLVRPKIPIHLAVERKTLGSRQRPNIRLADQGKQAHSLTILSTR